MHNDILSRGNFHPLRYAIHCDTLIIQRNTFIQREISSTGIFYSEIFHPLGYFIQRNITLSSKIFYPLGYFIQKNFTLSNNIFHLLGYFIQRNITLSSKILHPLAYFIHWQTFLSLLSLSDEPGLRWLLCISPSVK